MIAKFVASLLPLIVSSTTAIAQAPTITGPDQGYKLAYDAFCAGNFIQTNNIINLNKMGQISDEAFVNARFAAIKACPKLGGIPEGTVQAINKLKDVKRVFPVPGGMSIADAATGRITGSAAFAYGEMTLLDWHVQRGSPATVIRPLITAGADVNWRNEFGYPVIYHAAHKGNGDVFKLLVDAGARVDTPVPRMMWTQQSSEVVYSDFITIREHGNPYGNLKSLSAQLKPEFAGGGALWKAYQARGLTVPLLHYVASTCTEFRSPACWQMLGIMFDKGVKPPHDFLHHFFRHSAGGFFFTIYPDFPEAAAGLDRMISLGASLNAVDGQGKTILARLMQMNINPKTLQALIARGAQLKPTAATAATPVAPPSTASIDIPLPPGPRKVIADLNVRSAPSINAGLVVVLKPGQVVQVDGSSPDSKWSQVTITGTPGGWILNSALARNSR